VRKRFMGAVIAAVAMLACSALVVAQGRGRQGGAAAPAPQPAQGREGTAGPGGGQAPIPCVNQWQRPNGCAKPTGTLKPRDLSGVWMRTRGSANLGDVSALLTPAGRQVYNSYKPSFGPRAIPPAFGNDPIGNCDPMGLTRNVFTEIAGRTFEFVPGPDRIVEFFEYAHQYRTIWMDGRQLPKDPEPRWMGYSTGRWEGDTLVVDTDGIDERNWADMWGHPLSPRARVQERYHRTSFDTFEVQITITDPDYYTKPVGGETKVYGLQIEKGMDDRLEGFCVPSEEQAFNKTIRDPAAGIVNK